MECFVSTATAEESVNRVSDSATCTCELRAVTFSCPLLSEDFALRNTRYVPSSGRLSSSSETSLRSSKCTRRCNRSKLISLADSLGSLASGTLLCSAMEGDTWRPARWVPCFPSILLTPDHALTLVLRMLPTSYSHVLNPRLKRKVVPVQQTRSL